MRRHFVGFVTIVWIFGSITWVSPAWSSVPTTPEQEAVWLSKRLKPIPDSEWAQIAGPRGIDTYEIVQGDTLYDISKRFFGDVRYWPKIWALNNGAITNPHKIRPGNKVAFLPGSGTSLPGLMIQDGSVRSSVRIADASSSAARASVSDGDTSMIRSQEWKRLDGAQPWEFAWTPFSKSAIDEQGMDRKSVVQFKGAKTFSLSSFASTDEIEPLGEITAGRRASIYFSLGDMIFVTAARELQVGQVYSLVSEPRDLYSSDSGRSGFGYSVNGTARIVGVKDGLFVGMIEESSGLASRGALLIPKVPRAKLLTAIPGPTPLEGHLIVNRDESTSTTAQYKIVFIDRGTDDGVREGMVFRAYQYRDPLTGDKLTDSDYVINADLMVVQVSERVSTALILRSIVTLTSEDRVVLLTDVSELQDSSAVRELNFDEVVDHGELNRIDDIDVSGGLGNREAKELRQLERWEKNGNPLNAPEVPADESLIEPALPLDEAGPLLEPSMPAPETADLPDLDSQEVPPASDEPPSMDPMFPEEPHSEGVVTPGYEPLPDDVLLDEASGERLDQLPPIGDEFPSMPPPPASEDDGSGFE